MRNPAFTEDKIHRKALYLTDRPDFSAHFNKLSVLLSDVTDKVNKATDSMSVSHQLDVPTISIQLFKSFSRGPALNGHLNNAQIDNSTLKNLRIVVDHFVNTQLASEADEESLTILSLIKCDDIASNIRLTPHNGAFLQSLSLPWQRLEHVLFNLLLDICFYQAFFGNVVGKAKKEILRRKFQFDKNTYPDDMATMGAFIAGITDNTLPASYSFAMSCYQDGRLDEARYVNKWFDFNVYLKGVNVIDAHASGFESTEALTAYLRASLKKRAGQVSPKTLQDLVKGCLPGKQTLVFLERVPSNRKDRETVRKYLQLRKPSAVSIIGREKEKQFRHYIDRYCRFVRFTKERP
ncbi:hypothetical protein [Alteromonas antoniana]|uniref:hypothetical protein n=1 Tax=Alteromonas antoniana TaxID=2803813 RepID=UPI001C4710A4|nr:hypothetical protein [Alteromonas antoniana]